MDVFKTKLPSKIHIKYETYIIDYLISVSYTHLDVYKRQTQHSRLFAELCEDDDSQLDHIWQVASRKFPQLSLPQRSSE